MWLELISLKYWNVQSPYWLTGLGPNSCDSRHINFMSSKRDPLSLCSVTLLWNYLEWFNRVVTNWTAVEGNLLLTIIFKERTWDGTPVTAARQEVESAVCQPSDLPCHICCHIGSDPHLMSHEDHSHQPRPQYQYLYLPGLIKFSWWRSVQLSLLSNFHFISSSQSGQMEESLKV